MKLKLRPTVSRSVCLGVGLVYMIFFCCLTIAGFLMWDALSDEKIGL
jgi:hypothetical protein